MPIVHYSEAEIEGLKQVVELMAISARTAPKTRGVDEVVTAMVSGIEKDAIADEMVKHSGQKRVPLSGFVRDADNLRRSPFCLLVGVRGKQPKRPENPLNCGACGYETCNEFIRAEKKIGEDFEGPLCIWHSVDLGIAMASAVKTAAELNTDNRIMYTIGAAAKSLNLIEADVIVGIPISASGKNIYFDRK
ncbi:ferredoxin domain-containing protein [Thermoproteota archaeon]